MENTLLYFQQNVSLGDSGIRNKGVSYLGSKNRLVSPVEIVNTSHQINTKTMYCVDEFYLTRLIDAASTQVFKNIIEKYASLLKNGEILLRVAQKIHTEVLNLLNAKDGDDLVDFLFAQDLVVQPISDLIDRFEKGEHFLCALDSNAHVAVNVVRVQTKYDLMKSFWKQLPDGETLCTQAETQLAEFCSSNGIPHKLTVHKNGSKNKIPFSLN